MEKNVSFRKLVDGTWGISSKSPLIPGVPVSVTRMDGRKTMKVVGELFARSGAYWIYRIENRPTVPGDCELDRGGHRCNGCSKHYFGLGQGGYAGD